MSNFIVIGSFYVFCCTIVSLYKDTCFDKNKNIRYIIAISNGNALSATTTTPPQKYEFN